MPKFRKKPVEVEVIHIHQYMRIETPEGDRDGVPGEWLVTGTREEQYPIKPEVMEDVYEPANEEAEEYWRKHQDCGF